MAHRGSLTERPSRRVRAPAPVRPVGLTAHEMVVREPGVVQCRCCLGAARTKASLSWILGTPCEPTAQQRLRPSMTPELQGAPPMQSEAVRVALEFEASCRDVSEGSADANPSVPPSEAVVGLNGHHVLVTN
eukprot:262740-Pyramimonas_sp.AAC.1